MKIRILLLTLFFIELFTVSIYAVPAYPYPIKYKQPDGSEITIQLKGDERVHWAETSDGYTLLSNGKSGWEYAVTDANGDLKTSGILAREVGKRTVNELMMLKRVSKNIRFSSKQVNTLKTVWEAKYDSEKLVGTSDFFRPDAGNTTTNDGRRKVFTPKGTKKLIMILIEYTDVKFTKTRQNFVDLMNTQDYNLNGAQGSVRQYFYEMSYGQFNIETDVAPNIYTADYNMAYYGAPDGTAHDIRAGDLMKEAIQKANPDVDYTQYDNDGDGSIDGVYIIYAGYGEASGGGVNTIWPHASGVTGLTFDGKTASKYSCSNELNYDGSLTSIGVICHEFGHVCGAPDYYDTDYATGGQFPGTEDWDLMCGGCYNGAKSGSKPAHFNPFEKIRAGWLTPITLTTATSITNMPDITTFPVVYKYNTGIENEYYLLENRQKTGFNSYCPGHGLMIYHYSKTYWDISANKTAPQGFYPVCASATVSPSISSPAADYGSINTGGCPFPGTSNKDSFTDDTTPTAKSWAGNNTSKPLYQITESNGLITFIFINTPTINPILTFTATGANSSQINLAWIKNSAGNNVIIARNSTSTFGTPVTGTTYAVGNDISGGGTVIYSGSANSFTDTGLSASSTYYYQIWATDGTNFSDGKAVNGTTACSSISTPLFSEGFESGVLPSCWEQNYVLKSYNWSIQTRGINSHPAAAHSGSNLIRFNTLSCDGPVTKLVLAPFNLDGENNAALKFWHTQEAWDGSQDILRVYYKTSVNNNWNVLATYSNNISAWTQETISLPNTTSTYYIAFEGIANCGYGICIDDIEIWKDANVTANTWLGGNSTDWFTASNWSLGITPSASLDVIIPSGTTYSPVISANGALCKNITINNGATLAMDAGSAYTLSVFGDWTNNGSFTRGIGVVSFDNQSIDQTIAGSSQTDFYVLKVNKGSISKILEATALISLQAATSNLVLTAGTLKISSNSTITPLTSTYLSINSNSGIWNNGGNINPSGKQCNLSGNLKSSAGTANFSFLLPIGSANNITIEGGSINISQYFEPYTLTSHIMNYNQTGGTLLINSTQSNIPFAINEGSTFNMSGGAIIIQKVSAATCEYQNLATTYNVTGGTMQIGNASTTGSPVIRINSTAPVYNLTVNAAGTPTAKLMSDLTVNNDVTLNTGTKIDLNSKNLTVKGSWINNGGSLTASPTGNVIFAGAIPQTLNNSTDFTFNNLTIDNEAGATSLGTGNLTINGTLAINDGKVLSIAPGKKLTAATITNNAGASGFVLQSDATGTATFVNSGTVNTAIKGTVQQYLATTRNWYISSPVSNATLPSGYSSYLYREPGDNAGYIAPATLYWKTVAEGEALAIGTGYIALPTSAGSTLSFTTGSTGHINDGDITIPVTRTTGKTKEGYNLVGNPYPSYLNWMSVIDAANTGTTNMSTTMWYRTKNNATTSVFVFDTYNETANTGTNNNGLGAVTGMIPPMQAFWVRVAAGKTNGTLALNNSMRSHQDIITNKFRLPSANNTTQQVLRLKVSDGENSDEAILLFNPNASNGIDNYDSPKMMNDNASTISEIYTKVGTEKLVINGMNSIPYNIEIPLYFNVNASTASTFTIKAAELNNFEEGTPIYVKNNLTGEQQLISDGSSYTFEPAEGINNDPAFSVIIKAPGSITDITNRETDGIFLYGNANKQIVVSVKNLSGDNSSLSVYNTVGQKIASSTITTNKTLIEVPVSGVYMVAVNNGGKIINFKVIVK